MPELRHVYEVISQSDIDKCNFASRMHALGAIEPTGRERRDGAHRPAKLYRLTDRVRVFVLPLGSTVNMDGTIR